MAHYGTYGAGAGPAARLQRARWRHGQGQTVCTVVILERGTGLLAAVLDSGITADHEETRSGASVRSGMVVEVGK